VNRPLWCNRPSDAGVPLETPKKSQEQAFRESLQDVVVVVEKMLPLCPSSSDLLDILALALANEAQLRLVLQQVTKK